MKKRIWLWITLVVLALLASIIGITGENLRHCPCCLVGPIQILKCTDVRWGWDFDNKNGDYIQIAFVNYHLLSQDCDEEDPTWGYITREHRSFGIDFWRHTEDGHGIDHFFGLDMFGYYDRVDAECPVH